jgi:Delta7-sterol 5-desaturase
MIKVENSNGVVHSSKTPIWVAFLGILLGVSIPAILNGSTPDKMFESIVGSTVEYFLFAVPFFLILWVGVDWLVPHRRLSRSRWPKKAQVLRDILFSLNSMFVFFLISSIIATGEEGSFGLIYSDPGQYGWPWFFVSIFLAFFVHDTFFYWSHRALHHPRLFQWIHRVHHESKDPTPFSAYAFHPVESAVEVLAVVPFVMLCFVIPVSELALVIWGAGQILFNSLGHGGYEVYPANWCRIPILKWKTPAMHHYMHHQMVSGNYALYFRFWDKWCGTEFKDFDERYERFFQKKKSGNLSSVVS